MCRGRPGQQGSFSTETGGTAARDAIQTPNLIMDPCLATCSDPTPFCRRRAWNLLRFRGGVGLDVMGDPMGSDKSSGRVFSRGRSGWQRRTSAARPLARLGPASTQGLGGQAAARQLSRQSHSDSPQPRPQLMLLAGEWEAHFGADLAGRAAERRDGIGHEPPGAA